jgi:hypothetical protein
VPSIAIRGDLFNGKVLLTIIDDDKGIAST